MRLTTSTETTDAEWSAFPSQSWYTLSIRDYHAEVTRIGESWSVRVYRGGIELISYNHRPSKAHALHTAETFIEDHHYGVPNWRASTHG